MYFISWVKKILTSTVPWKEAKLKVPLKATSWPTDKLERVAVNSFGIGGANAHVSQKQH